MTKARREQVSLEDTPYYHCVVNCVRRAYLCGDDFSTGKNYDHRKKWVVDKLKQLSSVFAIDICAYAVMSNHYHVVLHVDLSKIESWSDKEIIERWQQLFAGNNLVNRLLTGDDLSAAELDAVNDTVSEWRKRLADISWFMRCLNESIARQANKEDDCKGRFWEGRFKSQALLDETALLSCMVYVDLNPIRARTSDSLHDSEFTSIQERIRAFSENKTYLKQPKVDAVINESQQVKYDTKDIIQPDQLLPFIGAAIDGSEARGIRFSPIDYFELLDWTGRAIREDKRGYIPPEIRPILQELGVQEKNWVKSVKYYGTRYYHLAGAVDKLRDMASKSKQLWFKGVGLSKQLYAAETVPANSAIVASESSSSYQYLSSDQAQIDLFAEPESIQTTAQKLVQKVKRVATPWLEVPVQEELFDLN